MKPKISPIQILVIAFVLAAIVGLLTGQWAWALIALAAASLVSISIRLAAALERIANALELRNGPLEE